MSAGSHSIHIPARFARAQHHESVGASDRTRSALRLVTFAALGLYGIERWATLMRSPPGWRLLGLLGLAVAMAGAVPALRRYGNVVACLVAAGLILAAFPVAGLRWHWFIHLRIAVSAGRIGDGLQALPNVLVPYLGTSHAVRLVIMLGAAVLLIDAGAVMAWGGRGPALGDGRRAAAALPLLALAVVPSTLVRPQLPYLQGLLLFALLAAFMWGERLRRDGAAGALAVAAVAGVLGAVVAPQIDSRRPWVDYRSWAGTLVRVHVDRFDWNQTYGPLNWPRSGHAVLTVSARTGDYWKAEDLDLFDGREWVEGSEIDPPLALPASTAAARQRWTQTVRVSITGMRTHDVIGAGYSSPLRAGHGASLSSIVGVYPGIDPGTFMARQELGPGTTYTVSTYSPRPSAAQLRSASSGRYPNLGTAAYRVLTLRRRGAAVPAEIVFPQFHAAWGDGGTAERSVVAASPYAGAYALARRLESRARTPYDLVMAVKRYLAHGFSYDEHPPAAAYPLETFLFKNKIGYCQQFSGAMALLLRMGGVPARVAAGFTSGAFDSRSHTWQVTDIDAHAWVEVWFPRYGWVRFDPTPAAAPARAAAEPILKAPSGVTPATPGGPHRDIGAGNASGSAARASSGSGLSPWLILPALAMAAVLARLAWIVFAPGGSDEQLLAELRRAMARTGRPLRDDVTLAELERRFADSPGAVAYVRSLRMTRYGVPGASPTAAQRRALRRQLAFGLGATGRLRALWALPPRPRAFGHGSGRAPA